jgi:hypothetical protein
LTELDEVADRVVFVSRGRIVGEHTMAELAQFSAVGWRVRTSDPAALRAALERERGTLATLQVTQLTAAEIAVGKLIARWGVAFCALTTTLPFVAWALAEGGVGLYRAVVVFAVVGLLMGVSCVMALAYSALLARSVTSALLAYATVFVLTVGTTTPTDNDPS